MAVTPEFVNNVAEALAELGYSVENENDVIDDVSQLDDDVTLPGIRVTGGTMTGYVSMKLAVLYQYLQGRFMAIQNIWNAWFGTDATTGVQGEWGSLKTDAQKATTAANNAATNANSKATQAETAAGTAETAATNANSKASLANTAATNANTAATNANAKANYAQTQGDYAKQKGDEASLVDANLNGNILTINNRSGSSKSLNVKGEKGDKGEGIDYSTMTPAEKQELTEYVAEEIAQEGGYVLYPVDESSITPSTIFSKNSILSINGVIYRAKQDTNNLPFTFVIEGNRFVVQTVYGHTALVRSSDTVSNDWAIWADASNDIRFRELEDRVARLESILR